MDVEGAEEVMGWCGASGCPPPLWVRPSSRERGVLSRLPMCPEQSSVRRRPSSFRAAMTRQMGVRQASGMSPSTRQTSRTVNYKKLNGPEKEVKEKEYHVEGVEYYDEAAGNPQDDEWDEEMEWVNAEDEEVCNDVDNVEGPRTGYIKCRTTMARKARTGPSVQTAHASSAVLLAVEDVVLRSWHGDRRWLPRGAGVVGQEGRGRRSGDA
ncbi:hypothetical protein MTO96_046834 [Rhipicephalus appendiculatus]